MLRFLLRIFRPSNSRMRNPQQDTDSARIGMRLYRFLLDKLAKSYVHYAISDTVDLLGGRVKVVHEFRDLEFEKELSRIGYDVRPKMVSGSLPHRSMRNGHSSSFRYFRFKDLLSVYVDNREFFIKHDKDITFDGTIKASLRQSVQEDIIFRSILMLEGNNDMRQYEAYDILKTVSSEIGRSNASASPTYKRHRGMEEDESF